MTHGPLASIASNRREFFRDLGISAAALPFLTGLASLQGAPRTVVSAPKRLVIVFTPNGTLPDEFWPRQLGPDQPLALGPMLAPLDPFREQMLMLKGVNNLIRGDGDGHMRGMSCLLTAVELNPGNIQGGSDKPAGWASGISIDQELRQFWQSSEAYRTRFGSLEFGVAVPNRADPWTRMCYAGNNQPLAPIDHPGQMMSRIYGGTRGREQLGSVLDHVRGDLRRVAEKLSSADRAMLESHMEFVNQMEQDIVSASKEQQLTIPPPEIDPEIELVNDNTPQISRMQIDLLVSALTNQMTHIASLQYMRSVGQARMRWLDIEEGHHSLSHEPDNNEQAYDKLQRINAWFAGEVAYLVRRLSETPEPSGQGGSLLDHTQVIWVNELGKGNSHTLNNIPLLLVGGGAGFRTNRALDLGGVPHNRFWITLAQAMGHRDLHTFGAERFCTDGPLNLT
jgi:hypothetical protein